MRWTLFNILLLILTACSSDPPTMAEDVKRDTMINVDPERGSQNSAASKAEPESESYADFSTLEQIGEVCYRIQHNEQIPLGCALYANPKRAVLFVAFEYYGMLKQYALPLADTLFLPYCHIIEQQPQDGYVVVVLADTRIGKRFSCQTWQWGQWVSIDRTEFDVEGIEPFFPPQDEPPPYYSSSLQTVLMSCKNSVKSAQSPFKCEVRIVHDTPVIVLTTTDMKNVSSQPHPAIQDLVVSYCQAATYYPQAMFIYQVPAMNLAKVNLCRNGKSSDWLTMDQEADEPASAQGLL